MILSDVSPQSDRKWNPDDSHKRIENFQRKLWRLVHDAIYLQKADSLPELSQEEFQKQVHKCWDARNYYLRVGIFKCDELASRTSKDLNLSSFLPSPLRQNLDKSINPIQIQKTIKM